MAASTPNQFPDPGQPPTPTSTPTSGPGQPPVSVISGFSPIDAGTGGVVPVPGLVKGGGKGSSSGPGSGVTFAGIGRIEMVEQIHPVERDRCLQKRSHPPET